jgi:RecB family exonuclease
VLHNILAKVITPNSNYKSKDELKKAFLVELGKIEGSIEYFYKKPLWVEMLEPFFEAQIEHFKQGYKVLACEFDVAGEINGLKFKGRVDRLDKKGDFSLLIDYKSGSTKSANIKDTQKLNDFQMSIYAKLLNKPLNSIDFAFIEILNNSKLIYLEEFENKDKKLIEHIEYLKNIDSFEASRCENLQNCRYCAYQLLCHRGEYQ